jgi:hypothetical protein
LHLTCVLLKQPVGFRTTFFRIRYASCRGLLLILLLTLGFQLYVVKLTSVCLQADILYSCQTWFGICVVLGMLSIGTSNCKWRFTVLIIRPRSKASSPCPLASLGPLGAQDLPCDFYFDSFRGDADNISRLYGICCCQHDV